MTPARVAAERAAVLFRHFGWTWGAYSGGAFVPTVDQIEKQYEELSNWLDGDSTRIETGRLVVEAGDRENGEGERYLLDLAETNPYTGEVME